MRPGTKLANWVLFHLQAGPADDLLQDGTGRSELDERAALMHLMLAPSLTNHCKARGALAPRRDEPSLVVVFEDGAKSAVLGLWDNRHLVLEKQNARDDGEAPFDRVQTPRDLG
jgi:hypothetical protein